MESQYLINKINQRIGKVCAWSVAFLGLFFFICRQAHLDYVLTSLPLGVHINYSASICLFLAGLGFLNIIYLPRSGLHQWLAIPILFISLIQILKFSFHLDLEIASVLIKRLVQSPNDLPGGLPAAGGNFILIALILLFWPRKKRTVGSSTFSIFCSFLALFIAAETVFIFAVPVARKILAPFVNNHFFTTTGQIVLAIGFICWNFYEDSLQKIRISKWLALIVVTGTFLFHLLLVLTVFQAIPMAKENAALNQLSNVLLVLLSIVGAIGCILAGITVYLFQMIRDRSAFTANTIQLFQFSQKITKEMIDTETISDATEKMLKILNELHGWQLLLYWRWDERKKQLRLANYASIPGASFPHFEKASRELIVSEETFISQIFENKKPIWFTDFSREAFSRALAAGADAIKGAVVLPVYGKALSRVAAAEKDAIKGAVALPVYERNKLLGLLELFRTEPFTIAPDATWVEFMKGAGTEFSLFIERRETETLRKELANIINASIDAIYAFDNEFEVTEWNKAAEQLYGWKKEEIAGKSVLVLYPPERIHEFEQLKKIYQNKRGYEHFQTQRVRKNKAVVWVDLIYSPILAEGGEMTVISQDITDRKNIERSKNEFISMVSHELRTPLTTIMGAIGLLKEKQEMSAEAKDLLVLADRNAERLKRIISDILDVEKLQLGQLAMVLKPVLLIKAIQEAIKLSQVLAQEAQITLIEGTMLPAVQVNADFDRLIQVILNLLSNAIKFSSPGEKVTVRMEIREERVRVSVQDWGRGIPLDTQGKIFEKFLQAEGGDTRIRGTGLGLSISKSIIEQMQGTIGFDSKSDVGSTFYFEFPIIKQG